MKLGLVVEGLADGAVCKRAAERLVPGIVVHTPTTMINRPLLLNGCGDAAATLLKAGKCDKVVVVWDSHPNWAEDSFKADCKRDRALALASLKVAGLENDGRVKLDCITRELETWLIADAAAITQVLLKYNSADRIQKVNLPGKPARHADPKGWLEDVFEQNAGGRKYLDRDHAASIFENIPDLKVLKQIKSFKRFAETVTGSKWPPTAKPKAA